MFKSSDNILTLLNFITDPTLIAPYSDLWELEIPIGKKELTAYKLQIHF
jgi:hypothetical protein